MPTDRIARTGIDIYHEEHGDGPPLLLIYGFTGNAQAWALQTPVFAEHYRTIIFDNRGIGRSTVPEGAYTIREMAEDTAGLLETLGIGRAHVVGYSMGGQIAQELAINHPQVVDRLVLTSTWARPDTLFSTTIDVWAELYRQGVDQQTRQRYAFTWTLSDQYLDTPGALERMLALAAANPYPPTPPGVWGQSRAILAGDTLDRLASIAAPTLVMVGRQDILTPVKFAEQLARGIPNATLRVLDRGGHGYLYENTAEFNQVVLDFLAAR